MSPQTLPAALAFAGYNTCAGHVHEGGSSKRCDDGGACAEHFLGLSRQTGGLGRRGTAAKTDICQYHQPTAPSCDATPPARDRSEGISAVAHRNCGEDGQDAQKCQANTHIHSGGRGLGGHRCARHSGSHATGLHVSAKITHLRVAAVRRAGQWLSVASTAQPSLDPRAGNSVIVPRLENASSQCGTGQLLAR